MSAIGQGGDPQMTANNLTPAYPTHPGEILKYSVLNEILNGHRPVTEKTALLFEAVLGVDAEPLMRLQLKYNMQATRKDKTFMERLAEVRKIAAVL